MLFFFCLWRLAQLDAQRLIADVRPDYGLRTSARPGFVTVDVVGGLGLVEAESTCSCLPTRSCLPTSTREARTPLHSAAFRGIHGVVLPAVL